MLHYRILCKDKQNDRHVLQSLFFEAPKYSDIVYAKPVAGNEAMQTFNELPPGKQASDKAVLGFYTDCAYVGCADVIRGYPCADVAFIGLLLISETFQGMGFGREALKIITDMSSNWGCSFQRLAVVSTNHPAIDFWNRHGFTEIRRVKLPDVTGEGIIMQRPIPSL